MTLGRKPWLRFALFTAVALVLSGLHAVAYAQDAELEFAKTLLPFDAFISTSRGAYQSWVTNAVPYAAGFFWFFAVGEFVWKMGGALMHGAGLAGTLGTAVRLLLIQSLWFSLLTLSPEYIMEIPAMFQQIGTSIARGTGGAGGSVEPQSMGYAGIVAFDAVADRVGLSGEGIVAACLAFGLLLLFGLIGITQTLLVLEAHFVVSAGAIMLGFAGSSWTRTKALSYLNAVLGAGLQLMAMELLLGLSHAYIKSWEKAAADGSSFSGLAAALVGLFLVWKLVTHLPQALAAIVRGGMAQGFSGEGGAEAAGAVSSMGKMAASGLGMGAAAAGSAAASVASNVGSDIAHKFSQWRSGGGGGSGGGGSAEQPALTAMRNDQAMGTPFGSDDGDGSGERPVSGSDLNAEDWGEEEA